MLRAAIATAYRRLCDESAAVMSSKQTGIGVKNLHGYSSVRASTVGNHPPDMGADGSSRNGYICGQCGKIGIVRIVEAVAVCTFCLTDEIGQT
jgi:hypothetical protein